MLTALELAGFKSFAEKTRFEFPDGITVIVGPNGSGKSNVVDAIKWVLGAQSAKALRGKDMIDVIFKGSSSAGRKPGNSAEATLVFDNSEKRLAVDAEEVHVTRRVYRSGEGEYLINGQACRLKDIRNLFRGTGVGVDAYSLIEQGKVDRMLQASPKERRIIFEEAAGISRFNAKKIEANRRLERVDQNLVRLKDIVDEVHTRLSKLKSQASKAQKYREMTSQLRDLRTRLGWTEYSQLLNQTQQMESRLEQLRADADLQQSELEQARLDAQTAELELHKVAAACQQVEGRLQDAIQRIAVCHNQQASIRSRMADNQAEENRQATRLATLRSRAGLVQEEVDNIAREVAVAQTAFDDAQQRARRAESAADELRQEIAIHSQVRDDLRQEHLRLLREAAEKNAEVAEQKNRLSELQQTIRNLRNKTSENEAARLAARNLVEQVTGKLEKVQVAYEAVLESLAGAKQELNHSRQELAKQQAQSALIQGRLSGASERLQILEQLQQHLDGVDAGARYIIDLARHSQDPVFESIHGLVADLLNVDVRLAPLIDTALGTSANILVLDDGKLIQWVRSSKIDIPGRLSLMRLDRVPARRFGEKVQLNGVAGVIGRADQLVRCKHKFMSLVRYLLGTTWVVESLDVALELGHFRGAGLRFITAGGELIESDGLLTIGAIQSASGLISRRSEIQDSKAAIAGFKTQFDALQQEQARSNATILRLAPQVDDLGSQTQQLASELARQQAIEQAAISSFDALEKDANALTAALTEHSARHAEAEPQISATMESVQILQASMARAESQLNDQERLLRDKQTRLGSLANEETLSKVDLARAEQKLEAVSTALKQSTRSQQERLQALTEAQIELERLRVKQRFAELEILELTSSLAEVFLIREKEEQELDQLAESAAVLREKRRKTAKQLDATQRELDKTRQKYESSAAELSRCSDSTQSLLKRFEDDYQIQLAELSDILSIQEADELAQLEAEAAQLRQDIASVGEINMAALAELDELQERYDFLNGQYEDLQAAKESLQRIIQKINNDSRRMFTETLEIIRQNFQKLYRKSFGGGNADIVLEEGEDVLECGIDIIATPPGKTELSNSLLSGGEKALTAVALLLAIFQYRPSPFCVLDEVDAPFDEANIGRFVNVLNEFLDWTKFIIVTHSKKTMTASTTLYGVTMQESGVSKQVAVRFEDVNEKGEIIKGRKAA